MGGSAVKLLSLCLPVLGLETNWRALESHLVSKKPTAPLPNIYSK